jgi:hypothetical protein
MSDLWVIPVVNPVVMLSSLMDHNTRVVVPCPTPAAALRAAAAAVGDTNHNT